MQLRAFGPLGRRSTLVVVTSVVKTLGGLLVLLWAWRSACALARDRLRAARALGPQPGHRHPFRRRVQAPDEDDRDAAARRPFRQSGLPLPRRKPGRSSRHVFTMIVIAGFGEETVPVGTCSSAWASSSGPASRPGQSIVLITAGYSHWRTIPPRGSPARSRPHHRPGVRNDLRRHGRDLDAHVRARRLRSRRSPSSTGTSRRAAHLVFK